MLGVNTQYMLGPDYLVAPVAVQNATSRAVYFPPTGDQHIRWHHVLDSTAAAVEGGQTMVVEAPLEIIPVYTRNPQRVLGL